MLKIDSVELSFSGRQILSGCYLEIAVGEVLGLLGRNGCGKSSLLKIIFGTLKADFKHFRIDERIQMRPAFKTGAVAYLPQHHFLPPLLTFDDLAADIEEVLLSRLNLLKIFEAGKKLRNFSGGELRLIECLWVLSRPAEYILLDEPFSGLSPSYIEFLQDCFRNTRGKAIVLTDHTYRPLLEVADRIVLMHNNSIYKISGQDDLIRYNYLADT